MSDPNDVVMVIRREKAEELYNALQSKGGLTEFVSLLDELEAKLAEALR